MEGSVGVGVGVLSATRHLPTQSLRGRARAVATGTSQVLPVLNAGARLSGARANRGVCVGYLQAQPQGPC